MNFSICTLTFIIIEFCRTVDDAELDTRVSRLNQIQWYIFDEIIALIAHQEQHKKKECACGNAEPPLFRFVSGLGQFI